MVGNKLIIGEFKNIGYVLKFYFGEDFIVKLVGGLL